MKPINEKWGKTAVVMWLVALLGGATYAFTYLDFTEAAAPALSLPGHGVLYVDSTTHALTFTGNGGPLTAVGSVLPSRTGLGTFGDSITLGTGATRIYPTLLAQWANTTLVNLAVSGDQAVDLNIHMNATTVTGGTVATIMIGANDQRTYTTNADGLKVYQESLLASIVWAATPDTFKVRGQNTSTQSPMFATYAGTWGNMSVYGSGANLGVQATANGSTATMTLNGDTVWVDSVVQVGKTSTYDISVDGVSQGPFNVQAGSNFNFTSLNGIPYGERMHWFSGLAIGNHTVVLTCNSCSAGNPVYFVWAGGNGFVQQYAQPRVVVSNITPQSAGYPSGGSAANMVTYNSTVLSDYNLARAANLNVRFTNSFSVINPATDLTDTLHPNNQGHANMAPGFYAAMAAP